MFFFHRPAAKKSSIITESDSDDDDVPLIIWKKPHNIPAIRNKQSVQSIPSCSNRDVDETASSCSKDVEEIVSSCSKNFQEIVSPLIKVVVEATSSCDDINEDTPTSSNNLPSFQRQLFSPRDIIPIPQVEQAEKDKPSRNKGKTAVLTASPYYNELKGKHIATPKRLVASVKRNVFQKNNEVRKDQTPRKRRKTGNEKNNESEKVDDDDDDTQCIICGGDFLKSKSGEEWLSCSLCKGWAHEQCTGYESDSEVPFICDLCQ